MALAPLWCRSPVHQVVTTGVERTSFVFFYYPNFEATLPTAVGDAAKMKGERLNLGQNYRPTMMAWGWSLDAV